MQVLAQKLVEGLSVSRACQYWSLSRQAYYQGLEQERSKDIRDHQIIEHVMEVRRTPPRLGTRKLQHVLRAPLAELGAAVGP